MALSEKAKAVLRKSRKKHHDAKMDAGKKRLDCYVEVGTKIVLRQLKSEVELSNEGEATDCAVRLALVALDTVEALKKLDPEQALEILEYLEPLRSLLDEELE